MLFLQSLQLSAGTATVLEGAGLGLAMTFAVGAVTFFLQRKLPYKKMLIVTGVFIGFVLVVMVGQTVRTMQGTGWVPITPIDITLPYWAGPVVRRLPDGRDDRRADRRRGVRDRLLLPGPGDEGQGPAAAAREGSGRRADARARARARQPVAAEPGGGHGQRERGQRHRHQQRGAVAVEQRLLARPVRRRDVDRGDDRQARPRRRTAARRTAGRSARPCSCSSIPSVATIISVPKVSANATPTSSSVGSMST